MTARRERHSFGPRAIELARFLRPELERGNVVDVAVLTEIDRRWPRLSFHDFFGAVVLAEALALQPRGRA
jgi:hypothetical protein